MCQIYAEMFEQMDVVHRTITDTYSWFTHDTPKENLPKVRRLGLWPKPVSACPQVVIAHRGLSGRRIVCLHPVGSQLRPTSSGYAPFIRLAVGGADLPPAIGLDWSYVWNLAEQFSDLPLQEVIQRVAASRGSIVSYHPIPLQHLRVWGKGEPDNPSEWKPLVEVQDANIFTF